MSIALLICTVLITLFVITAMLKAQSSAHRLTRNISDMKALEGVLKDRDVIIVIQRMIREPRVENPKTEVQRRRNKRYILHQARLKHLVPDEKTRRMIYTFISIKKKRHL